MGGALSIFVLLSLSVFIVRVASVALRLTGLSRQCARFQALSAFSGTGFTTREAESIVNYPIRRRIISLLMIVGNLGLVTVLATLVVSFVQTEGEMEEVAMQLFWLLAGLALLWFLMLNKTADRIMCSLIGKALQSTTFLGERRFSRLLQLDDGVSVCEHVVHQDWLSDEHRINHAVLTELGFIVLGLRSANGELWVENISDGKVELNSRVILFGKDTAHEKLIQ